MGYHTHCHRLPPSMSIFASTYPRFSPADPTLLHDSLDAEIEDLKQKKRNSRPLLLRKSICHHFEKIFQVILNNAASTNTHFPSFFSYKAPPPLEPSQ